jgi:hypothetical protein
MTVLEKLQADLILYREEGKSFHGLLSGEIRENLVDRSIISYDDPEYYHIYKEEEIYGYNAISNCLVLTSTDDYWEWKQYTEADLKAYYCSFNYEATFSGVSLLDKCIPLKAVSLEFVIGYMEKLLELNKKMFKNVREVIVNCKKPSVEGYTYMFSCKNIHDMHTTNSIPTDYLAGTNSNSKICYVL